MSAMPPGDQILCSDASEFFASADVLTFTTGSDESAAPVITSTPEDPDACFAAFMVRAAALAPSSTKINDANVLVADIVASVVPLPALKPLAVAIAKATAFEAKACLSLMQDARKATALPAQPSGMRPASGLQNPDAHPKPNPLHKVLDSMVRTLMHQVVFDRREADAVALFCAGTFGYEDAPLYPRLAITSPTKRCGKSTLLETVGAMASTPLRVDSASASSIFRVIESKHPTLLCDEVDAWLKQDEGMRGLLNSGFARNGSVMRSSQSPDGKDWMVTEFSTFAPMALAGIGGLPETVLDRSLIVRLQRAPGRGAGKKPLRFKELGQLRDLVVPHLVAHGPTIRAALAAGTNATPSGLHARARDCWEPLRALAEAAGGSWPARADAAALFMSGATDAPSQREILLEDLREIVKQIRGPEGAAILAWGRAGGTGPRPMASKYVLTAEIVTALLQMEHRPWPEFGKDGRGITPQRLASLLKPFKVEPETQRVGNLGAQRVYSIQQLQAVFRQYL
ncbi:MAG: hypothetical protein JWO26_536 [Rhodospirillales bacterium]|nr:hypothetical protein [Rhodospirillales bacterium]